MCLSVEPVRCLFHAQIKMMLKKVFSALTILSVCESVEQSIWAKGLFVPLGSVHSVRMYIYIYI